MARKVSNLLLALISALILLFIAIAFYDAFTRKPVNREAELSSSSSSGTITKPSIDPDTSLTPSTTPTTEMEVPGNQQDAIQSAYEASSETPQTSSSDAVADTPVSDPETGDTTDPADTAATIDSTTTTELSEDPSHILREKPELRDALPPVPSAPPSPVLTPPGTSTQEAFSTTTDNATSLPLNTDPNVSDSSQFPTPLSDFPAPVIPTGTVRPINPASPVNSPAPITPSTPNHNFPAPSDVPSRTPLNPAPSVPNTDFPTPLGMKSTEGVSPTDTAVAVARKPAPRKVANKSKPSAETLQLRQLRSEKEQLRRSLGLQ